jgi:hypothetical protein
VTTVETSSQLLDDRYQLLGLIAVGGMGEVWRARDTLLDRAVAVKLLRSQWAADPVFIARFRSEARHAAALSHPNIAAVLDYGETTAAGTGERLAYLVMELVDGAPLSARLADEGALDTGTTLSVLRQAAAGLAEAHRAGVVHRDVKPANILLRPDGTVKLTDFGIAWSAASVPLTRTGQVIGTPQYMSPEQAMGEQVSPASDVYALGMVGYESLTGHTAFEGDNPVTVALKQVQAHPEPLPAELPSDVRALIDAALVKDPAERLPDGEAFLTAVEETLAAPSVTAEVTRPVPAAAPRQRPAARASRPAEKVPVRRRTLLVVLPLLLLVALGIGAVALFGPETPSDVARSSEEAASPAAGGVELAAEDYVGRPVAEVVADLTALGLTVRQEEELTAEGLPGTVLRLEEAGGTLEPGDEVRVVVAVPPAAEEPPGAGGPAPTVVPEPAAVPGPRSTPEQRAGPVPAEAPEAGTPASGTEAGDATGSDAPGTPVGDDAETAAPTSPTGGEDTGSATPSTPSDGGSQTPTTPPGDEGSGTPTAPPEGDGTDAGTDEGTDAGTGSDAGTGADATQTQVAEGDHAASA